MPDLASLTWPAILAGTVVGGALGAVIQLDEDGRQFECLPGVKVRHGPGCAIPHHENAPRSGCLLLDTGPVPLVPSPFELPRLAGKAQRRL